MAELRGSETAKAAGLAGAMIANNVIALASTVVFARLLSDYGSLAALISYFLILSVVGQALQVATAREGVLGHLGVGAALADTVRRWTVHLMMLTAGVTVVSVLLRAPIASAVGVKHDQWAAAIGLPAGMLWLELSILRGVLQGVGDYKGVGVSLVSEQAARLVTGAALAGAGLGVTGAYLGTPLSFIAVGVWCMIRLRKHIEARAEGPPGAVTAPPPALSLWSHVKRAWAPIAGLIVIAVLQNIDIIAAKHRFTTDLASAYGATAVAAKVLIWVAIGAGFYLVPEVSRRRAAGEDTRPILFRALAIILVCAVPVPAHLRRRAAPAAQARVRGQASQRLGLAVRPRGGLHRPGRHLSGHPVHARAAADLVLARLVGGGRGRADPAAERLAAGHRVRRRGPWHPGGGGSAGLQPRPAQRRAAPAEGQNRPSLPAAGDGPGLATSGRRS